MMHIQSLSALPMQSWCLWCSNRPRPRADGQQTCGFREQKGRRKLTSHLPAATVLHLLSTTAANFPHKRIILLKGFRVPKLSNFQTQSKDVHGFLHATWAQLHCWVKRDQTSREEKIQCHCTLRSRLVPFRARWTSTYIHMKQTLSTLLKKTTNSSLFWSALKNMHITDLWYLWLWKKG